MSLKSQLMKAVGTAHVSQTLPTSLTEEMFNTTPEKVMQDIHPHLLLDSLILEVTIRNSKKGTLAIVIS